MDQLRHTANSASPCLCINAHQVSKLHFLSRQRWRTATSPWRICQVYPSVHYPRKNTQSRWADSLL